MLDVSSLQANVIILPSTLDNMSVNLLLLLF